MKKNETLMEGIQSVDKWPRSILVSINGILGLVVVSVVASAYAKAEDTAKESARSVVRIDYLEKRFDSFENKLDKIGDRLGVKA